MKIRRGAGVRHSWDDEAPSRFLLKTERLCGRCGLVWVTRFDRGRSQIPTAKEFWRGGEMIASGGPTPACEPAQAREAAE